MPTTYGKEYKDFDLDFGKHPAHGDLLTVSKTNQTARFRKGAPYKGAPEPLEHDLITPFKPTKSF